MIQLNSPQLTAILLVIIIALLIVNLFIKRYRK